MSIGDRELIARASRGDVEAFSKLVLAHTALVRGVTLRLLGSQEAQDASQEVWVKVWANIKTFRGERLQHLAVHNHGKHLPLRPAQGVAPKGARGRRGDVVSL